MSKRAVWGFLALVVAIAMLAAACGGGSSSETTAATTGEAEPATGAADATDTGAADASSGGTEDGAAASGEPIVIGGAFGLTGLFETGEKLAKAGAELAIEDINASGGVLGRPLELITEDAKADINISPQAALSLIEQGAEFIITMCDYDLGGPAARVAEERGIPAIGCASAPQYGVKGIGPHTFNTFAGAPTEGAVMAQWAWEQGWRAPYLLCDTSLEFTRAECEYFKKSWEALGGSIVGEDTFQNSDASIAGQITRLKGASPAPDFLVLTSYPPGAPSAVRQLRSAGIELPILSGGGSEGDYWLEAVPNLGDLYYVTVASVNGDDPRADINEIYDRLRYKNVQVPFSNPALSGYASIETLARGIERAGTTDGDAVAAEISKFSDEALILGPTTYTDDCHIPLGRPMVVIKAGDPTTFEALVEPASVADSIC